MRWGRWYRHDGNTLMHQATGTHVDLDRLFTPVGLAEVVLELEERGVAITAVDVAHLMIAANEIQWCSFDFTGVGDWVDEEGANQGALARGVG